MPLSSTHSLSNNALMNIFLQQKAFHKRSSGNQMPSGPLLLWEYFLLRAHVSRSVCLPLRVNICRLVCEARARAVDASTTSHYRSISCKANLQWHVLDSFWQRSPHPDGPTLGQLLVSYQRPGVDVWVFPVVVHTLASLSSKARMNTRKPSAPILFDELEMVLSYNPLNSATLSGFGNLHLRLFRNVD